ncbi:MAG: helix-turn-helix transcriptional regulator [Bacteroidota bacterium]|nr:helix-turn-helix transcriptional regulator [Bacteroidota bacterium]
MKNKTAKLKDPLVVTGPDGKQKIEVDLRSVKRAALTLRALHHSLRKKLLELIEAKGKVTVTELYAKLKIEQSVASQHLAILRRAQVVNTQRDGKKIYYSVNGKRIAEIVELAKDLAQESEY